MNDKYDKENAQFEAMYAELERVDAPRRKITLSEFVEFLPLYQRLPDDQIPVPGSEEAMRLHRLSQKFAERVNVSRPLELIDDATGETIVELPAHWATTKLLTQSEIRRNENFSIESSHDFPGVAENAHKKLQAGFIISQALESSKLNKIRKAELVKELKVLKVLNPEKFSKIYEANKPKDTKEESVKVVQDDELEFTVDD